MKKAIALLLGLLLLVSAAASEDIPLTMQAMTKLGSIQTKLDHGITIEKVYYTDGYGFSASEFTTCDPEEIARLWNAVNDIVIGERVEESITDWYPQIVFCLSDGTNDGVWFEAHWLNLDGRYNYEISNAEEFWSLTSSLVEKYTEMAQNAVPVGQADPARNVITAVAAEINPDHLVSVAANVKILSCDDQACVLTLLVPEQYRPDDLQGLQAGDAIYTQGQEVAIQTISEKDGDLVLNADTDREIRLYASDDGYYRIMEANDHTWSEFATVRVPVSERLLFLDDIDPDSGAILSCPTVHNRAGFLSALASSDDPGFDLHNVMAAFDDRGELALVRRYYVPWQ